MAKVFVLDDGVQEITVNNKFGKEICKLHIPSGDIGILDRFKELTNGLEDMLKPLENLEINNDGTSDIESVMEKINTVQAEAIERINKTFDMDDAGNLFATRNAFSTVNGVFYLEKVIEMLGNIVNDALEEESKKTSKRIDKYVKDLKK